MSAQPRPSLRQHPSQRPFSSSPLCAILCFGMGEGAPAAIAANSQRIKRGSITTAAGELGVGGSGLRWRRNACRYVAARVAARVRSPPPHAQSCTADIYPRPYALNPRTLCPLTTRCGEGTTHMCGPSPCVCSVRAGVRAYVHVGCGCGWVEWRHVIQQYQQKTPPGAAKPLPANNDERPLTTLEREWHDATHLSHTTCCPPT